MFQRWIWQSIEFKIKGKEESKSISRIQNTSADCSEIWKEVLKTLRYSNILSEMKYPPSLASSYLNVPKGGINKWWGIFTKKSFRSCCVTGRYGGRGFNGFETVKVLACFLSTDWWLFLLLWVLPAPLNWLMLTETLLFTHNPARVALSSCRFIPRSGLLISPFQHLRFLLRIGVHRTWVAIV